MLIDIHVHSKYTPGGSLEIAELVSAASERGLDGFCLTDIHTVAGLTEAKTLAAKAGLVALLGFEALTDRGHFLVFVPEPDKLPVLDRWLRIDEQGLVPFRSLAQAVLDLHGILIAAHPYDRSVPHAPGDQVTQLAGVAAIEVLNARHGQLQNDLAEEVAAGIGLPGVAGSDARTSLDDFGRVACLVPGPVLTEADLIDRIQACDIWPVLIDERSESKPRARRERQSGEEPHRGHGRRGGDEAGRSRGLRGTDQPKCARAAGDGPQPEKPAAEDTDAPRRRRRHRKPPQSSPE